MKKGLLHRQRPCAMIGTAWCGNFQDGDLITILSCEKITCPKCKKLLKAYCKKHKLKGF